MIHRGEVNIQFRYRINANIDLHNIMKKILVFYLLIAIILSPGPIFAQSRTTRLQVPIGKGTTIQLEKKGNKVAKKIFIRDHLSSTKVILNENGKVANTPLYYPYGSSVSQLLLSATARQYTGQRKVSNESAVYNYNARYYNPQTGFFVQPDTVEGPARYTYVAGNPIMLNDPTGKCPMCVGFLVGAGLDIGFQMFVQGQSFSQISLKSALLSGVGGATGVGISAKIGQIATTTTSKIALHAVGNYTNDLTVAAIDTVISKEPAPVDLNMVALNSVGKSVQRVALGSARTTVMGKTQRYALDVLLKAIDPVNTTPGSTQQPNTNNSIMRSDQQQKAHIAQRFNALEERFYDRLATANVKDVPAAYEHYQTFKYSFQAIQEEKERISQIRKTLLQNWRELDTSQRKAYVEQITRSQNFIKEDTRRSVNALLELNKVGL